MVMYGPCIAVNSQRLASIRKYTVFVALIQICYSIYGQ